MKMTLREALDTAMREACGVKGDLAAVQAVVARVGREMRSAGFSVTTPVVTNFGGAFQFIRSQLQAFDRLPQGDERRRATVDREVRAETSALNNPQR